MIELYGYLDMATRDWVDGLFSNIFRELNRPIEQDVCIHSIFYFQIIKLSNETTVYKWCCVSVSLLHLSV